MGKLGTAFTPITNPSGARLFTLIDEGSGLRYKINITDFFALVDAGVAFNGEVAANAVKFPAVAIPSADPNTLDDYQEGTYTPTITGSGGGSSSVGVSAARFSKIGKKVHISMSLTAVTKGDINSNVQVSIPFQASSESLFATGVCRIGGITSTAGTVSIMPVISPSGNLLTFQMFSKDDFIADIVSTQLGATYNIFNIDIVYYTDN